MKTNGYTYLERWVHTPGDKGGYTNLEREMSTHTWRDGEKYGYAYLERDGYMYLEREMSTHTWREMSTW